MSGVKTEVKDCMLTDVNHWGYHELQVHQVDKEGGREGSEGGRREVKDCMLADVNHWGYHELQVHQVGREGKNGSLRAEAYSLHFVTPPHDEGGREEMKEGGILLITFVTPPSQDAVLKKCEVLVEDLQKRMAASK